MIKFYETENLSQSGIPTGKLVDSGLFSDLNGVDAYTGAVKYKTVVVKNSANVNISQIHINLTGGYFLENTSDTKHNANMFLVDYDYYFYNYEFGIGSILPSKAELDTYPGISLRIRFENWFKNKIFRDAVNNNTVFGNYYVEFSISDNKFKNYSSDGVGENFNLNERTYYDSRSGVFIEDLPPGEEKFLTIKLKPSINTNNLIFKDCGFLTGIYTDNSNVKSIEPSPIILNTDYSALKIFEDQIFSKVYDNYPSIFTEKIEFEYI